MADRVALNRFLASVERRAFRMAQMAVRNPDDALDIVQDVMLALVRKYADRPEAEWAPLFQRMLATRITDHHRRHTVQRRRFGWSWRTKEDDDPDAIDPLLEIADGEAAEPLFRAQLDGASSAMVDAVEALPLRQQQAILLRLWEGLDVADTAMAMGCSEGSVKTHLSRAVHSLRQSLQVHW